MISKGNLDKRICDIEVGTTNTQTYREFIRQSEEEFGIEPENIDEMYDSELREYMEQLDYLWEK